MEPYTDLELKKAIDAGQMPGPKLDVTGPYLEGKGAFAIQLRQLTGPEDAARMVDYWANEGITSFKVYNYITMEELKAAIDHAHAHGLKITGTSAQSSTPSSIRIRSRGNAEFRCEYRQHGAER